MTGKASSWKKTLEDYVETTGISLEDVCSYLGLSYPGKIGFYNKIPKKRETFIGIGMAFGLDVSTIDEWIMRYVPRNIVVSQSVNAGEKTKRGSTISVVISKGAAIEVPDIKGKDKEKAVAALKKIGLKLKVKEKKYSDKVKKGAIIKQTPSKGSTVEEGTTVNAVISKGVEQVKVPDVTGKTKSAAQKALKKAKLKTKTDNQYSSSVAEGKVISQSVSANSTVDKNTTVAIIISKGPQPVVDTKTNTASNSSPQRYSGNSNSSRSGGSSSGGFGKDKLPHAKGGSVGSGNKKLPQAQGGSVSK